MKKKVISRNYSFWTGFAAALAAGVVASGVMLFLSISFRGVSLPETVGSELTALMPPPMFDYLHRTIGAEAKQIFFYGILVGQCLLFALSGALYNRRVNYENQRLQWYDGLLLALILWLFAGLILLPLSGAGVFGANLDTGISNGLLSLAIVGIVFGLLFVFLQRGIALQTSRRDAERSGTSSLDEHGNVYRTMSRRTLLKNVAIVTGIALAGVVAWRFITAGVSTSKVPVDQLLEHFK